MLALNKISRKHIIKLCKINFSAIELGEIIHTQYDEISNPVLIEIPPPVCPVCKKVVSKFECNYNVPLLDCPFQSKY